MDMQNGFARCDRTHQLSERIESLLNKNLFDVIIATRFLNDDNSIYEKLFGWKRLKTKEDRTVPPGIAEHVDYFADKYIYNCINPSFIQRLCQLNNGDYPEKVFIVGVDTDCCVMITATALFENNIRPIVLTQYVDSNGGPDSHKAGLLVLKRLVGEKQLADIDPISKEDLDRL